MKNVLAVEDARGKGRWVGGVGRQPTPTNMRAGAMEACEEGGRAMQHGYRGQHDATDAETPAQVASVMCVVLSSEQSQLLRSTASVAKATAAACAAVI